MRQLIYNIIAVLAVVITISGCKSESEQHRDNDPGDKDLSDSCIMKSSIKYAKGFDLAEYDDYQRLTIFNPWVEDGIQQRFYLVTDASVITPSDGKRLLVPIGSVAISSCTHTEFLDMLGCIEKVNAMCSPELIYNATLRQRHAEGKIVSIGDAFNVNHELLLSCRPDAFLVASYSNQNDNTDRLIKSGINVVYNNEWTETTLLARAEWLKMMGALFGKTAEADSLFSVIESNYMEASIIARQVVEKPAIMAGGNFKGTWYMPGGQSWMGRLIADAGGDYYYANDSTSTSLPLNFESVLNNFNDCEVWINAPTATIRELLQIDSRHNLFAPLKNGRVYSFYAKTKPRGANDFWESAVAHPDIVLKDMIWALHPTLLPDYNPQYIMHLQ